ncbi:MAG: tryptophan-rich sensory protein [Bacteroidota bacterium]
MIDQALHIVDRILLKWKLFEILEASIVAMILTTTAYFIELTFVLLPVVFLISMALFIFWKKPWARKRESLLPIINRQLDRIEYSSHCLLVRQSELSALGRLQQLKAAEVLIKNWRKIKLPFRPNYIFRVLLACSAVYAISQFIGISDYGTHQDVKLPLSTITDQAPAMQNSDSAAVPEIVRLQIQITPPKYTGERTFLQTAPEIKVIEGSLIHWEVTLNTQVDSVLLVTSGTKEYLLKKEGDLNYSGYARANQNGFYNFLLKRNGVVQSSELFPIEVILDEPPTLELSGIDQRVEFQHFESKRVSFNCLVEDDFKLTDAYIVATVSKGSGESVKFREERLQFDHELVPRKSAFLTKTIDLNTMNMTPGDELYFYAEAVDNRSPSKQKNRTPTFFISILDTTDIEFSLAGDLGIDVMPEYFRSQRQIIIDTEKLVSQKYQLAEYDFNFTSNELGFDQKSLRIKYGQFMGEEFETELSGSMQEPNEARAEEEDDPLAEFSHNHDGDNEHNLVEDHDHDHDHHHDHEHEHDHEAGEPDEENPLEAYQHLHDDPEEATFFTVTIKEKLRQALTVMWEAELHLRLYKPEKSLTYQYKALKLLKEIKNHARVYVHRIGFDPPPIKEESRLKGDLEEVQNISKKFNELNRSEQQLLKDATSILAKMKKGNYEIKPIEKMTLNDAGNIVGRLAVDQPGKYLHVLDLLNKIIQTENLQDPTVTNRAMKAMLGIIETELIKPKSEIFSENELSRIFRENLNGSGK